MTRPETKEPGTKGLGTKGRRREAGRTVGPAVTLGDLKHTRLDVFCWCNRCGHNAVLEIGLLIRRLGPALPVPQAAGRMRCTGCGARDVSTRPAWPSPGPVTRHSD